MCIRDSYDTFFDNQHTMGPRGPFLTVAPTLEEIVAAAFAGHVVVPGEFAWHGYNDRFAIGPVHHIGVYAAQYLAMQSACECTNYVNPEAFLRCHMCAHGVGVVARSIGQVIVRSNGVKQVLGHAEDAGLVVTTIRQTGVDVPNEAPQKTYWLSGHRKLPPDQVEECPSRQDVNIVSTQGPARTQVETIGARER